MPEPRPELHIQLCRRGRRAGHCPTSRCGETVPLSWAPAGAEGLHWERGALPWDPIAVSTPDGDVGGLRWALGPTDPCFTSPSPHSHLPHTPGPPNPPHPLCEMLGPPHSSTPPFQPLFACSSAVPPAVLGSCHSHLPRGHSGKTTPKLGRDGSDPFNSLASPSPQPLIPTHNNPPAAEGKRQAGDPWAEGNSGLAAAPWKPPSSLRLRQKKGPAVPDIPQITPETGKKEKPCPRMQRE